MSESMKADTIFINGKVITVDRSFSLAEAVAVHGMTIMAVGTQDDILTLAGNETRIIDLHRMVMLPGINDAHLHATLFWGSKPPLVLDAGFPGVKSIGDIVKAVDSRVKTVNPGEWIYGTGLNPASLEESRVEPKWHPTRWDLDPVSPENPVYLGVIPFTIGEQAALLNTKALELTGLTTTSVPPPGAGAVTDPVSGEMTGLFKGAQYIDELVRTVMPPATREQKKQAIRNAMKEMNALGITSMTEGALGPGGAYPYSGLWDTESINVYQELRDEGSLTIRVGIMVLLTPYGSYTRQVFYDGLKSSAWLTDTADEWVNISGIKLFADGIPLNKSAWMYDEYEGGGNGRMVFDGQTDEERGEELSRIILDLHEQGYRVGIHVTGDRSIDACIDGFIKAEQRFPKGLRHYLIHGDFLSSEGGKRMAEYDIGVSVQPALLDIALNFLPFVVGDKRASRYCALRTMLETGVHVAGGSDAPVTYPDWKAAVQSAVTRTPLNEGDNTQNISVEDAIRMYTIEGAWQDRMEHLKGSIEAGKLADLCVLDGDILTAPLERIKEIRTVMTMVGGIIVYNNGLT